MMMIKPVAAAVTGALISGVAMYTVGAKTATVDAFTQTPALVQMADGQYAPASHLVAPAQSPLVSAAPAVQTAGPRRAVYRTPAPTSRTAAAAPAERDVVSGEEAPAQRTWKKTAMIIGGSAASGAGVGAIMGGKKGALIGAAIGGGAASIYESTKRR